MEALNADLKLLTNRKPELFVSCTNDSFKDGEVINDIAIENGVIKFEVQPVYVADTNNGIL